MKNISPKTIDNIRVIEEITKNKKGKKIEDSIDIISQQYLKYAEKKGNPWELDRLVDNKCKDILIHYFDNPCQGMGYIEKIRNKLSPNICPMCGSLSSGTVDHYLPQSTHPDWALYSFNLVPACKCNSGRGNSVKGNDDIQRVIHPYHDSGLNNKIIDIIISEDNDTYHLDIQPCLEHQIRKEIIDYHIEVVVNRSQIKNWMHNYLSSLLKTPRELLYTLPREGDVKIEELTKCIREIIEHKRAEFGTDNNWYSLLLCGVIKNEDLLKKIAKKL